MQYLIDQARVFPARAAAHDVSLGTPEQSRQPRAVFISCSDERLVPALITAALPGDLFELRTYGGVVPPYDPQAPTGESRTIEYAVDELNVSDIIVCGHSHCEVVTAALHDHMAAAGIEEPGAGSAPLTGDLTAAAHWHVLAQLDALSNHPCVVPRLAARSLHLHAWFHEIETGATLRYVPRASSFLPL
ncbi:carbonic anhydrase [Streptomyces sp. BPPL-273]|uniref:carbonic anhydrase n=1 Tax=Streptomyces TaxID=1883 RepID=UPI0024AFDF98|nr:carbonic anhydrase [Streptomyces sp. BPPL-273]WHM29911.1 carbonic anhydrase [Streptomyces sp. BPPL-273]